MGRKIIRVMDGTLDAVVLCICALLLAIGVYSLCDNLYVYRHAKDSSILSFKPEQNKTLGEIKTEAGEAAEQSGQEASPVVFENQVAWLTVDNTPIDFPVMQGESNYDYLNKDARGKFPSAGRFSSILRTIPSFGTSIR